MDNITKLNNNASKNSQPKYDAKIVNKIQSQKYTTKVTD